MNKNRNQINKNKSRITSINSNKTSRLDIEVTTNKDIDKENSIKNLLNPERN